MFDKILIANRGEIACRIIDTCRKQGVATVAVYSSADRNALHVAMAGESVRIGAAPSTESYLNIGAVITAAKLSGAQAIHPGYGFLSENANFARIVEEHGMAFIGPTAESIAVMGDKVAAKDAMRAAGVPVVPGSDGAVETVIEAIRIADEIGYPVIVKAAAGGGGRGMKVAEMPDGIETAFRMARTEAKANFGDETVYIEKYLGRPRHVEVQVIGDGQGHAVHLFERDCSLQRNHQKVVEEAPCPVLDDITRQRIGTICAEATAKMNYRSAGTFEFLYEDGEFFFIEMNTRVQVEHPITEIICNFDIVAEMIKTAGGAPLSIQQSDVVMEGHAIECRINAEDPVSFAPSPGLVQEYHAPGGLGVRVDSALYAGYRIPPYYDSLIAKLIVHGRNRDEALMRLRRTLNEMAVSGISTTIPLHQRVVEAPSIISGDYDIHWLERFVETS